MFRHQSVVLSDWYPNVRGSHFLLLVTTYEKRGILICSFPVLAVGSHL